MAFACELCDKRFKSEAAFANHERCAASSLTTPCRLSLRLYHLRCVHTLQGVVPHADSTKTAATCGLTPALLT